jgi:anti-anti-sigma factor
MEIDTRRIADVVIMRLSGELRARAEVSYAFQRFVQDGHSKFILDLSRITTIDSVGFTALLEIQQLAEKSGGSIRICGLCDHTRKLFKAYGVDHIFSIMKDEQSALVGLMGAVPVNCGEVCHSRYLN